MRRHFQPREAAICRASLGLDPARPVFLVMGGSQGASGINQLVLESLPLLANRAPDWQWFHVAGPGDAEKTARAYAALGLRAVTHSFFARMELALGAATVAVSRAGASSLAELAAMRVPAVLIPYPAATDNHQFHNARAFEATGAGRLLEQKAATPEILIQLLGDLIEKPAVHANMQAALAQWHRPSAAEHIVEAMLAVVGAEAGKAAHTERRSIPSPDCRALDRRAGSGGLGLPLDGRPQIGPWGAGQAPIAAGLRRAGEAEAGSSWGRATAPQAGRIA